MLFYFSDLCRYFTDHLLESIHIWTFGTIHCRLPLIKLQTLESVPQGGARGQNLGNPGIYAVGTIYGMLPLDKFRQLQTQVHARGWGSRSNSRTYFLSLNESFIIEQQLLFRADFLFVISDLRAAFLSVMSVLVIYDPG